MEFSTRQNEALRRVGAWYKGKDRPWFYLAGYAGTGKTTLARYLAEGVEGTVLFAAFTGKAASVMRASGCAGASTLHSLLYAGASDARAELIMAIRAALADPGLTDPVKRAELEEELRVVKMKAKRRGNDLKFTLNPESPIRDAKLLVLDEVSMVNTALAKDALSFRTPILVLGDPAQLPPVHGTGYFTANEPDYLLTEIHRQALDNPIVDWATRIRTGKSLPYEARMTPEGLGIRRVRREDREVDFDALPREVQVLTGKNVVRRNLNRRIRASQGFTGPLPRVGEKLVCLKNDHEIGLLNGVICYATSDAVRVDDESLEMDVRYEGVALDQLDVSSLPFDRYDDPELENEFIDRRFQQFDYGYALTVHKSQGSQWDEVILADDHFMMNDPGVRRKWLYTAITRASRRMTIVD